jgi:DNA modification methylase
MLADELRAVIESEAATLEQMGFDDAELAQMLAELAIEDARGQDVDEVPEPPDEPVTRPGDLWILGSHRLLCGSSADWKDVDRLLGGERIHLLNTDPPYNVKVEPRSNNAISAGLSSFTKTHHQSLDLARHPGKSKPTSKMRAKDRPLANDFIGDEDFALQLRAWFGNAARAMLDGRSFYIWGGYANVANYPSALAESGLYFSQSIIWDKQHPVLTRKDFMGAHEWCFYGWKEGAAHEWFGPNNATDLWSIHKVNPQSMVHLTEKPVELALRAIEYSSRAGENVLDLFGGSGSTLIGCEQSMRRAFVMEIDAPYCDVIIDRWQRLTSREAALENGRTFAAVARERRGS